MANWASETVRGRPSRSILPHLAHLIGVSAEEVAARLGIDVERPLAPLATPDHDLRAAIEGGRGTRLVRGLRQALAERGERGNRSQRGGRGRGREDRRSDASRDAAPMTLPLPSRRPPAEMRVILGGKQPIVGKHRPHGPRSTAIDGAMIPARGSPWELVL